MSDERQFRLFFELERASTPITADTLAETLGVQVRTVYRDLVVLRESGVPIRGRAGVGLSLNRKAVLGLGLTVDQAVAIAVTLRSVRGEHLAPGIRQGAASGLARILETLPDAVARHIGLIVAAREAATPALDAHLLQPPGVG